MKVVDLRQKSVQDLEALKLECLREQFNLRMQRGLAGQTQAKSHLFKQVRQKLARIETILTEKARG